MFTNYEKNVRFKSMPCHVVHGIWRRLGVGGYRLQPTSYETLVGGDKGAVGALVKPAAVNALKKAVNTAYPSSRPGFADK